MTFFIPVDADFMGGGGLFEDVPMDPPDVSQIEAAPADDTVRSVPEAPAVPGTTCLISTVVA